MSGFYSKKDQNYQSPFPIQHETKSPLDVRLLFDSRDELFQYDDEGCLYNGIIASYENKKPATVNEDGTVTPAIPNRENECFQWFKDRDKSSAYGNSRWRPFESADSTALFKLCPSWNVNNMPALPDSKNDIGKIHLVPLKDANGNPVQVEGENGLSVWRQFVWAYTGEESNWTNGQWSNAGDIYLKIDTSAFVTATGLSKKLDRGDNIPADTTFGGWVEQHMSIHDNINSNIGTFQDFIDAYEASYTGNGKPVPSSELNITVGWGNTSTVNNDSSFTNSDVENPNDVVNPSAANTGSQG